MSEPFDPYYTWLGIPPNERPLDYYRFLGLRRFESDTVVIESAADQRMAHVRAFQTGPRSELAARILNKLAAARVALLNPQKKAAYDQRLRSTLPSEPLSSAPHAREATPSSALLSPAASKSLEDPTANRRLPLLAIVGGSAAATAVLAAVIFYLMSNNKPADEKDKPAQAGAVAATPAEEKLKPVQAVIVASRPSPTSDPSSAPVDLLSRVDLAHDVRKGHVFRQGNGLVIVGDKFGLLNLPYELPPEYQIDMAIQRLSGTDVFRLSLSISGRHFEFNIDEDRRGKRFTGIGDLDGKLSAENPQSHQGTVLPKGVSPTLSLIVRSKSVKLIGDGATIYEWEGDPNRIVFPRAKDFDFGILAYDSNFEIQRMWITPLVGPAGEPAAVATSREPHSIEPAPASTVKPASAPQQEAAPSSPAANVVVAGQSSAIPAPAEVSTPSPVLPAPQVHAVPLDSTNAPLASAALVVFKEDCYRCHGRDGSNEGGLNFILQSDKLIANRYIVPGDASASRLYKRLVAGTMPPEDENPRPTIDQIASLKKWIEAGAPQLTAPPANRPWITNADIVKAIYDDVNRRDSADRRFARYFALTHLYNAGLSDDELQTYRLGLSKLINSLSWGDKIVVPQPIDAAQTILRIDLRDFKWTEKTWDAVVAQNPYSFLADTSQSRDLAHLTRTELPFVRADWFVAAASVPPLYHQVLEIPETCAELESLLRISVADDIQQLRVARAGFNKSGISRNNRLIERHATYFGAYWRSYDFAHSDGRANLFAHPLGPDSGANSFRHDGGEIIFNLPNGLQAYMLVDGAGDRLDKAALTIVSDPRRPDRAVANGLSCISCHVGGIHEKADEVREAVHANLKSFSAEEAEAVAATYLPPAKMRELQSKDAERFLAALKLTGALPSRTEPVLMLVQRFEMPLDLTMASAELGIEPRAFLKLLDSAPLLSRTLAALRSPAGTIQRQVLLDSFDTLAVELKLHRAPTFAAATASGAPPHALNVAKVDEPAPGPAASGDIDNKTGLSSNDLTPVAVIKLAAEIPDIILGKDRRWVYLLNASDGTVQRIDTQTLAMDSTSVKAVQGAERLKLSPNGRVLYVSGSPNGHDSQNESQGQFQIIPTEKFESAGTFTVPFDPWDFAPDDKGRLLATSGSGSSPPVRLVDTNKKAVVSEPARSLARASIRLSHDEKTFAFDGGQLIDLFSVAGITGKSKQPRLEAAGELASGGPFEFSADDKFLIAASGPVGRLGNSRDRHLPITANLDRGLVIGTDPRSKLVFLVTPDRQLKVYSAPDFELNHSLNVGARVHAMAVDTVGGRLYAAVNKEINPNGRNADENTVSNVEIFDISGIVGSGERAKPLSVVAESVEPGSSPEVGSSKSDKPVPRLERPASNQDATSNDLRPLVTFRLAAFIPDVLLATDRQFVYFLNASDGEIRRLDTDTLKLDDTVVKTGPGAQRLRLTPNGKTLYAITAPDGLPREGDHGTGKIIVVPTQLFQASDRFTIPVAPLDLAPDNNGRIYILPPGQMQHIQLANAQKKAIVSQPAIVWFTATLNLSHDEKSLVTGNEWGARILPTAALLAEKGTAQGGITGAREFQDKGGRRGNKRFELSPDGKFLAVDAGRVGRVGNSRDEQLPEVANLGAWDAIAFDPSHPRVFVSTQDKQLKVFSLPDFELQRAFSVGRRIYEMTLDAKGGKLYAAIADKVDRGPRGSTAGDLAVFDVSDLSGKISAVPIDGVGREAPLGAVPPAIVSIPAGANGSSIPDKPPASSPSAPKPTVSVVSARFGGGKNWADVTERVRDALKGGKWVWATTDFLKKDPTPGWKKQLVVTIDDSGKRHDVWIHEGDSWHPDAAKSK